jgi:hypothetical protein
VAASIEIPKIFFFHEKAEPHPVLLFLCPQGQKKTVQPYGKKYIIW